MDLSARRLGRCDGPIGIALAAAVLLLAATGEAPAQSTACLRLVNELAAIESRGGFSTPSPRYQEYDRAVREQQAQIVKTQRAAQFNGCGTLFGRGRPICDRIQASLQQMQANLAELQRTRDQLAGPASAGGARRSAILREMDRLGCQRRASEQPAFANREPPRRRTLLEQIFGVSVYREDGRRGNYEYDPDTGLTSRYGTFSTLCVRKCDGYYFPISFSTVQDRFERDDLICQSMCPGTDVELYIHRMPGQEREDMISYRTGQPYADMSTAFNYRKAVNPDCTCRFSSGYLAEIAGTGTLTDVSPGTDSASVGPAIPTPQYRIDPGLDPETVANTEGGLTVEAVARLGGAREEAKKPVAATGPGKIRIVGPEFFPVQ